MNRKTFNGIYDRKANTTRMYAEKEGIKDDLTGFMAFHPKACSAQGEYGMIIDAGEVMTWLEENPEAAENEKLSALKEIDGKQHIHHFSEQPEYSKEYMIDLANPVNQKVYVIDDIDHSTMLLAEEY